MARSRYDRREFLQASAAASAALWLAGAAQAGQRGSSLRGPIEFYKIVFDRQHPAAVAFGSAAGAAGLPVQGIGRDVTSLWYEDLYHRWRAGPAAIAGMTPAGVAFCLQRLGQEAGMRLIFRAEHRPAADGSVQHQLLASIARRERIAQLDDPSWPAAVAQLALTAPAAKAGRIHARIQSTHGGGFAFREPLVTWVLAPVTGV